MRNNIKGLGNQQGSLLVHYKIDNLLSWLAGIIDGEGWVGINVCRKVNYTKLASGKKNKTISRCVRPAFQVSNRDIRILKRCEEIINYFGVKCYWGKHIPVVNQKGTPHIWVLFQDGVEKILNAIMPYLVSKQDEAKIVLEYIKWRRQYGTFNNHKIVDKFYQQLKQTRINRPFRDRTTSIFKNEDDDTVQPT